MGQKVSSLGLGVGRMLRRAEDRWFTPVSSIVSVARCVTVRPERSLLEGARVEATPRTHRKPEEVSTFNFSPCLAGKR